MHANNWLPTPARILTQAEVDAVLIDLTIRAQRSRQAHTNKILFRLAVFTGLRASEIGGLSIANLHLSNRPTISVPASIAKGHKSRTVPIWSDPTLQDLCEWRSIRLKESENNFTAPVLITRNNQRLHRSSIRRRFLTACNILGEERCASLTVHDGRHTFVSRALAKGIPVQAVRDAAGHASLSTTSMYAHLYEMAEANYSID